MTAEIIDFAERIERRQHDAAEKRMRDFLHPIECMKEETNGGSAFVTIIKTPWGNVKRTLFFNPNGAIKDSTEYNP